jgi:hypothetical protein
MARRPDFGVAKLIDTLWLDIAVLSSLKDFAHRLRRNPASNPLFHRLASIQRFGEKSKIHADIPAQESMQESRPGKSRTAIIHYFTAAAGSSSVAMPRAEGLGVGKSTTGATSESVPSTALMFSTCKRVMSRAYRNCPVGSTRTLRV